MKLTTKRIYESPADGDGYRILVDRLWPRGVSKQAARLDLWLKDIAPSPELRTWFGHRPERFDEFRARYRSELEHNSAVEELKQVAAGHKRITLLYAARDPEVNHARVLAEYMNALQ